MSELASLKQQRDQLAVQIELGKAEAKEEWDKVTAKLDQLSKDYEPLKEAGKVFLRVLGRQADYGAVEQAGSSHG